ncbi:carbohydrate ABC transporter ATP-binding protein, CUT1 family [Octadecabacter temperatus]|uniref:sn-glycerol-3-phosphate import ATP-binding protein UgpC n=1 Tax=Octadecabacter temperatus TaxID=1458307 RepID=A0A0K0Y1V3_9RHOB|nr:sn-glycerol-3-phosphate ABC transporter ATP-binding protein UgpC [Octadecabacter temperatus]AKS44918.1 sn-glycerol-3-phosphate import ATP-binding protein UgpC [Octadecabacter temperatus]SIN82712.1 carbohydrate ABC transporter ATP-binding protein, CUT1 family [Octadecabacter temperatus]
MGSISLKSVEKWFGDVQVIKGIDLDILDGELIIFVGPSGCGKSTLLRMISGLEETSRGQIMLDGNDVTHKVPSERELSMVFQSYALYPHMSVEDNVGFALKTAGAPKAEIEEKVNNAAEILKLDAYMDRRPKDLSGGQRQRVAIGRAIVRKPKGFLFDEPLSNLDASLRVDMRFEIARLHKALETTMVYVTHDQVEAMTLADRIVVLKDGLIMQVGSPRELYEKPDNVFVAQFIGSPKMNLIACSTTDGFTGRPDLKPGAVQLGIRPEHIGVVDQGAGHCDGVVQVSEYLGADFFHYIDCGPLGLLTVRTSGAFPNIEGQTVGLKFETGNLHFFGTDEQAL